MNSFSYLPFKLESNYELLLKIGIACPDMFCHLECVIFVGAKFLFVEDQLSPSVVQMIWFLNQNILDFQSYMSNMKIWYKFFYGIYFFQHLFRSCVVFLIC